MATEPNEGNAPAPDSQQVAEQLPNSVDSLAAFFEAQETARLAQDEPGDAGEEESPEGETDAEAATSEDPEGSSLDATDEEESDDSDSEEEQEEEEDPDLSQFKDKAKRNIQKRIDTLTARAKTAEEKEAQLQRRLEELEKRLNQPEQKSNQPQSVVEQVESANSAEQLQQIQETAKNALKWARRHLHQEIVEVGDKEFTHEQIVAIYEGAEEALEAIPQRAQLLQQAQQAEQLISTVMPGINDPNSPEGQFYQAAVNSTPQSKAFFNSVPNGKYLVGCIIEGNRVIQERLKSQGGKNGEATKETKEVKQPPLAPKLPGASPGATQSRHGRSEAKEREIQVQELTKDGPLSEDQLAAYFQKQYK